MDDVYESDTDVCESGTDVYESDTDVFGKGGPRGSVREMGQLQISSVSMQFGFNGIL